MSGISIAGAGAVSPAGWGCEPLDVLLLGKALSGIDAAIDGGLPVAILKHPVRGEALRVRAVPRPQAPLPFLAHPRLRRTSPITQYVVAAALEALQDSRPERPASARHGRLGVILCVKTGCVNYSRRFYDEVLKDPSTASPLVFPETVFNAPASHLAAVLETPLINYTMVGDAGMFLAGLSVAAEWLLDGRVDGCLVIGAEERDWITAEASALFSRRVVLSEGAGALYLRRHHETEAGVELSAVSSPCSFAGRSRADAAVSVRKELAACQAELLVDSRQGVESLDRAEADAWSNFEGVCLSPKMELGEGLAAGSAWQCVCAVRALSSGRFGNALVSVAGWNQQAIGAHFAARK